MGNKKAQAATIIIVILILVIVVAFIFFRYLLPEATETFFSSELEFACSDACIEGENTAATITIMNEGIDFKVLSVNLKTKDIIFASLPSQTADITSGTKKEFVLIVESLPKPAEANLINYKVCIKLDPQSPICEAITERKIGVDCTKEQCDPADKKEFKQIKIIKRGDRECNSHSDCLSTQKCEIYPDGRSECIEIECEENQEVYNHTCVTVEISLEGNNESNNTPNETTQEGNNQIT